MFKRAQTEEKEIKIEKEYMNCNRSGDQSLERSLRSQLFNVRV